MLLVDDIVSSGGTLIACAKALKAAGATAIDVIVTHALFPPEMATEFADAGIRSIRSTIQRAASDQCHPARRHPSRRRLRREINGAKFSGDSQ